MSGNRKLLGFFLLMSLCGGLFLLYGCVEDPTLPVLTTAQANDITINSAVVGGNVTADGGAEVTARGICWGTATGPAIDDHFKASGTGPGEFTCTIDGLTPNTLYFARAYAENSVGIAYGNEVTFTTGTAAPTVTTGQVTGVTANAAVCGGTVTYNGGGTITEKGVCWSKTPDPDLQDSYTNVSTGAETFSCTMTNLSAGTRYYARAYVKNAGGTAYGEQIIFNTKLADIEGNLYGVVYIGTQVWMSENLKTTKYNNDTPIPYVTDNTLWSTINTPAYCWYNNEITYKDVYGALYNWYAVATAILCPAGWHVPTDSEYNTLEISLGMAQDQVDIWGWRGTDQGAKMKSTSGWDAGGNGTNTSGFTGLAGGYRQGVTGNSWAIGTLTYWWTASEHDTDRAWYRRLDGTNSDVYKASTSKRGGKYVRCVKN